MNDLTIRVGPGRDDRHIQLRWWTCGTFTREVITGETIYIPCVRKMTGRSVVIRTKDKILILCEVAVYGKHG